MATAPDPIHALIKAHRQADAAWGASSAETGNLDDALGDREREALNALLKTTPSTLAGVGALLRYLGKWGKQSHGSHLFEEWAEPRRSLGGVPADPPAVENWHGGAPTPITEQQQHRGRLSGA